MKDASAQLTHDRIRKLWENTDFLSTLFESLIGYAIIAADFDGNIIAYNEGAHQIYGYTSEEVIGKQNIEIFFPEEFIEAGELQQVIDALTEEGSFSCEGEKVRKNGERFPAQLHFTLTKDNEGEMVGFVEIVGELTERRRAAKALQESEKRFRKIVESNSDGIVIVDQEGVIRFVNPATEAIFARKSESLLGQPFGFPIEAREKTEIDIIRGERQICTVEMHVAETDWEGDTVYLASLRDITERKQAEEAQERLSQQLQVKVSELETFSYGIAHDLRSPLLSIEGFCRLLKADIQNLEMERMQEDIRLLESGVRKMGQFLNRTLEYSRAGYLMKPSMDVPFGKIVEEVIMEFAEQVRSIGATVSVAETFPGVYVDRMRIMQVLTNLIQNSINYRDKTMPLKIEIGYWLSEDEVVFFVRDNGMGIDANETEQVFDLFYRGTTDSEGSGIGLAVVKKIIEAHQGRIWVESQSEKGTTMCFALPQHRGTNQEQSVGGALKDRAVLVKMQGLAARNGG